MNKPNASDAITVLRSTGVGRLRAQKLQKTFRLTGDGRLEKVGFQMPTVYRFELTSVSDLASLCSVIAAAAQDPYATIVRGLPIGRHDFVRKSNEHLAEHPEGTLWAMIDFDDLALPAGVDPLTEAAIEWAVRKLPPEFHDVSYFYQHSSSAGILNPDGTPLKRGLNAHVFFWLSRRIKGDELCAHIKSHCLDTGFYRIGTDRGNSVRTWYGFDPALFNPVQAHYIAAPEIGEGVRCLLQETARQGMIEHESDEVAVPEISRQLLGTVRNRQGALVDEYKRQHGYVPAVFQTRNDQGISTTRVLVHPTQQTGRDFVEAKVRGNFATLFFTGESSPGSWFVVNGPHAHIAHKFGGDRMLLRELSPLAHVHVRDVLKWFLEVPGHDLELNQQGYLPRLSTFAHSKASLVLAPTGSGKTKAIIDYVAENPDILFIYSAPTIALVNQMRNDLRESQHVVRYYKDVWSMGIVDAGVVVTTNQSLPGILKKVYDKAVAHVLVIDEIHLGLDEFLKTSSWNRTFESAILKARKTFLLTGTLTDVQRNKIPDVVRHALSSLSEQDFCRYEFSAVKRNPLSVRPTSAFYGDFMKLLRELKEKLDRRERLPRAVLILPTSKLEAYRMALEVNGLTGHAHVVSRTENMEDEIEDARTSSVPILIASPLFAVGLNFEFEPEIFWTNFDHIKPDTNAVVQTLNRANRGDVQCEVRLYANVGGDSEFRVAPSEKLAPAVAERFKVEATLTGLLDSHFDVNLATYKILRDAERTPSTAVNWLVKNDAVQNYRVVFDEVPPVDKDLEEQFRGHKKAAKAGYAAAIDRSAAKFSIDEVSELLLNFEILEEEAREAWRSGQARVPQEMDDDRLGTIVNLCAVSAAQAKAVKVVKLKRLFALISPWVSGQYDRERFPQWKEVEAEKCESLAVLVDFLRKVRDEGLPPRRLASSLTRNKKLRAGILALSSSDVEFQQRQAEIERLETLRQKVRQTGSSAQKDSAAAAAAEFLGDSLGSIGVHFEKHKVDGKTVPNYDVLKVPPRWPLGEMHSTLLRRTQSLRRLPREQNEPIRCESQSEHSDHTPVSMELCESCVHIHRGSCVLGRPQTWLDAAPEALKNMSCDQYFEIKLVA